MRKIKFSFGNTKSEVEHLLEEFPDSRVRLLGSRRIEFSRITDTATGETFTSDDPRFDEKLEQLVQRVEAARGQAHVVPPTEHWTSSFDDVAAIGRGEFGDGSQGSESLEREVFRRLGLSTSNADNPPIDDARRQRRRALLGRLRGSATEAAASPRMDVRADNAQAAVPHFEIPLGKVAYAVGASLPVLTFIVTMIFGSSAWVAVIATTVVAVLLSAIRALARRKFVVELAEVEASPARDRTNALILAAAIALGVLAVGMFVYSRI